MGNKIEMVPCPPSGFILVMCWHPAREDSVGDKARKKNRPQAFKREEAPKSPRTGFLNGSLKIYEGIFESGRYLVWVGFSGKENKDQSCEFPEAVHHGERVFSVENDFFQGPNQKKS